MKAWKLFAAVLLVAVPALATAGPYAAYVFPAGGQVGTTFRVTVGGQGLKNVSGAFVSGGGAKAVVLGYVPSRGPLSDLQEEELRRLIKEGKDRNNAVAKKAPVPAPGTPLTDLPPLPELAGLDTLTNPQLDLVTDLLLNRDKRARSPMDETATVEVTLDPGASPGTRELRLRTPTGISNPVVFQVGTLPEAREPDGAERIAGTVRPPLTLPVVWNGQVLPGEADQLAVTLVQGQVVSLAVAARALVPYMADAVPGWFQAFVSVKDPQGREVAWADDTETDPDPRLKFTAATGGSYSFEVRDALWRGRRDFVFRATLGVSLPIVSAPAVGPGWKAGALSEPGQVDVYPVKGTKEAEAVVEVRARRDGSPADTLVKVVDARGAVVAWNDDAEDKSAGLVTHQADPYLRFRWPADGDYRVLVSEAQGHGGPGFFYRVRTGPPVHGFTVLTTRSVLNLVPGGKVTFTVQAFRQDGWDGDIALVLGDAPDGFVLKSGPIPRGQDTVEVTLTAPKTAWEVPFSLPLVAVAVVDGVAQSRPVVPADAMMQAFATTHLVPARELVVCALPPPPAK